MPTHVALLRGINVGGHNLVAMAALREVVTSLGHTDVATYVQSGNVVFSTNESDTSSLADSLKRAVADGLGVTVRVMVLSRAELAGLVQHNPFPEEPNAKALHAVVLAAPPDAAMLASAEAAVQQAARTGSRDELRVHGRVVYLHTPDGFGRSELVKLLSRGPSATSVGKSGTGRNWSTITTLLAMCSAKP